MSPEKILEIAKNLQFSMRACHRCRNIGTISEKQHPIYETDSLEEIADAYRTVPCPSCIARISATLSAVVQQAQKECEEVLMDRCRLLNQDAMAMNKAGNYQGAERTGLLAEQYLRGAKLIETRRSKGLAISAAISAGIVEEPVNDIS